MSGILLIDKPAGPTSHDVVARMRQVLKERSIGHAGTLDPAATGLLVLMLGKATRLAPLLMGHEKVYDASIRFGFETTTDDAAGERLDAGEGRVPTDDEVREALARTTGMFDQIAPRFSAKRVDGTPAYKLARRDAPVDLKPAQVTLIQWTWIGRDADIVHVRLETSAGFYVRALARDLGRTLGTRAHLSGLRRTKSGHFEVGDAVPLGEADQAGPNLANRVLPMAGALPDLPTVVVGPEALVRVRHGNPISPQLIEGPWVPAALASRKVCLLDPAGTLVALADLRGGLLHPSTVLVSP